MESTREIYGDVAYGACFRGNWITRINLALDVTVASQGSVGRSCLGKFLLAPERPWISQHPRLGL